MALIYREFSAYNLTMPTSLDFESLGKLLIKLVAERFINLEKIYQTARLLGISEKIIAQIIVFTQMRDALKQIAPKYFRDARHRDELQKAFIAALEKLEEKAEEEEEEEENDPLRRAFSGIEQSVRSSNRMSITTARARSGSRIG